MNIDTIWNVEWGIQGLEESAKIKGYAKHHDPPPQPGGGDKLFSWESIERQRPDGCRPPSRSRLSGTLLQSLYLKLRLKDKYYD